jgi:hypothetical protein
MELVSTFKFNWKATGVAHPNAAFTFPGVNEICVDELYVGCLSFRRKSETHAFGENHDGGSLARKLWSDMVHVLRQESRLAGPGIPPPRIERAAASAGENRPMSRSIIYELIRYLPGVAASMNISFPRPASSTGRDRKSQIGGQMSTNAGGAKAPLVRKQVIILSRRSCMGESLVSCWVVLYLSITYKSFTVESEETFSGEALLI